LSEQNSLYNKRQIRHLKRNKLLTCAIGGICATGAVIISDKRILRNDYEAANESKIQPIGENMILVGSGTTALLDKLAELIKHSKIADATDFQTAVNMVEDLVFDLRKRYEPRIGKEYDFEALVMGLKDFNKGEPYLRWISKDGISEEVKTFSIIGHGAPYVTPIFKLLYDNMLTANELGVLGYLAISSIICLGLDQSVGCDMLGPDVVVMRVDEKPAFLNPLSPEFIIARNSLKSLRFRFKLVDSIWGERPQAYKNYDSALF
jgi:20S proteasome alpha/beta subunit